jgi:hypothetical protein
MESLILELNKTKKDTRVFRYTSIIEFNSHYKTYFSEDYEKRFVKYLDIDKCNNGFICEHPKLTVKKKSVKITTEINSIKDLIQLTHNYPLSQHINYDILFCMVHQERAKQK